MVASQTKSLSFEEFLEWYPEDNKRYEVTAHRNRAVLLRMGEQASANNWSWVKGKS